MRLAMTIAAILALLAPTAAHARGEEAMRVLRKNMVILFQGDSITDGGRWRTGSDYNHIMGQDYAYMIAGEMGLRFPERGLVFLNRGIGGHRVRDLAARWQADTIDLRPDLLSILVGINDTLMTGETLDEYERTYDRLLADTLAANPKIRIVLGEPLLMPVGKYKNNYQATLADVKARQAVVLRLGAKYRLPVVRYQRAFDAALKLAPAEHWSWDGIHPTYAGHALMAREWLDAVAKAWPAG